jgi:hypothetical protein
VRERRDLNSWFLVKGIYCLMRKVKWVTVGIKLYNERDGEIFPTALNATKTLPISVPPLILRISIEYLKAASSM